MKRTIILLLGIWTICCMYGCIAGGYFIRFTQPDLVYGENTKFRLELLVNAGSAEKAFKEARLFYRVNTDAFHEKQMILQNASDERVVFVATIPAFNDANIGETIEYYFSFGNDNKTREYPFNDEFFYGVINHNATRVKKVK